MNAVKIQKFILLRMLDSSHSSLRLEKKCKMPVLITVLNILDIFQIKNLPSLEFTRAVDRNRSVINNIPLIRAKPMNGTSKKIVISAQNMLITIRSIVRSKIIDANMNDKSDFDRNERVRPLAISLIRNGITRFKI